MKNFGVEKDINTMYLKGNVKAVITEEFIFKNDEKISIEYSTYDFNMKGEVVCQKKIGKNGTIIYEAILDHSLRVTGWNVYNNSHDKISNIIYKLNKFKQKTNKFVNGVLEEIYKRDKWGNLIEVYYCSTGAKDIYKYNYKFAIIQLSIPGKTIFNFGKSKKIIHYFENDKFGNITSIKTYEFETNKLLNTEKFKINKFGDVTEHSTFDFLNENISKRHFKYTYEFNNWILKQQYDEQYTLTCEIIRQIEYQSNDLKYQA